MKRTVVLLVACVAILAGAWLSQVVVAQAPADKKIEMTKGEWEKLLADRIAKAVAEKEAASPDKQKPVSDEAILKAENWHTATFNKAQYVIYTGPGQIMFHHWVDASSKPAPKVGGAPVPAGK